ncbi:extracellular solute-binding protein [Paenibacillus caseinilyticus]|uniref:ABC transporter substrate-binding protein n=1 Tax=Paenibacillus mucilaginosus K02 TaxID=997761 RepID=I0BFG3_9BACL|nr:extracellular solute-binding protein [Paenibacillus mucilaginosus]AFH61110.1 ABC transporter substrate-binding protein [Paenibacillus mucilaginosus K02]
MNKRILTVKAAIIIAGFYMLSENNRETRDQAFNGESSGVQAAVALNMMAFSFGGGGWPEDHPMVKQIDQMLQMQLSIDWTPIDTYSQKLNVLAASNELPDLYSIEEQDFNKWKGTGAFLDIKPYLTQYPNLTAYLAPESLSFMNPRGKVYGLPYYLTDTRDALIIRRDWLDKLGLPLPITLDDFLRTATAFALKDPDGNGKADTSGFSFSILNNKFNHLEFIMGAFGLGNEWIERDHRLIPMQVQTEELKAFLTFINKAYESGALDKQFPTNKLKDPLTMLEKGKLGISAVVPNEYYTLTLPQVKRSYPNAELVQLLPPKGPSGLQSTYTNTSTMKIVINANIDQTKQQKALQLLDYLLSDEGYDQNKNGIQGIHYTAETDGSYKKLPAFDTDRPQLLTTWFFRRLDPDVQIRKWDDPNTAKQIRKFYDTNAKYRWPNPAAGLASPTQAQKGPHLQAKWMDTILKIAVGELPMSEVDEAAAAWRRGGGEQIIQEINSEYQKTLE